MSEPNFRIKFIADGIQQCVENFDLLTDWEKGFIANVQNLHPEKLTDKQYDVLQKIVPSLKARELGL